MPGKRDADVQTPPNGKEAVGLDNLQRGFHFYSWRTFIALNSPADGSPIEQAQADKPTLWEDMNSFKQLLDVMLPAGLQPPKWPADRAGMENERERLVPPECLPQHQPAPTKMIVKMIRELQRAIQDRAVDRPAGPLRHLRHPDEPADVRLHDGPHDLTTKAGQAANADLSIDFPAGQNLGQDVWRLHAQVSWKILSPRQKQARNFHMVQALG